MPTEPTILPGSSLYPLLRQPTPERSQSSETIKRLGRGAALHPTEPFGLTPGKVRNGACVTNAPSEYDGAELYER